MTTSKQKVATNGNFFWKKEKAKEKFPLTFSSVWLTGGNSVGIFGEIGSTMRKDMDSVSRASLHYPRMTSFIGTVKTLNILYQRFRKNARVFWKKILTGRVDKHFRTW